MSKIALFQNTYDPKRRDKKPTSFYSNEATFPQVPAGNTFVAVSAHSRRYEAKFQLLLVI